MATYEVMIWKTMNRTAKKEGDADYAETVDTGTPTEALKALLTTKGVQGTFYTEIRQRGDIVNCWAYTDENPELRA